MKYDQLKLDNQFCFPIYAASRLVVRLYQPFLDELGITYTQYLVLMVLWEKDEQKVTDISKKLLLNTNTLTPLLKRMENKGFLTREKTSVDERKIVVKLSAKGVEVKEKASSIPAKMIENIDSKEFSIDDFHKLKEILSRLLKILK
ncbi:MAG: MarR family transcriptional regulator [Marinifilaceae bacterium]|jgi:DNA-binding MarR family transcriptional regulator|nr:MarR family transcriptional regulator [Marinifilaceae bacterium]